MKEFEDLRPGDEIIACDGCSRRIRKVLRVTKTMIILDDNSRFRKDGSETGNGWYSSYLIRLTPELKEKVLLENERKKLMSVFRNYKWEILSLEKLREIREVIRK